MTSADAGPHGLLIVDKSTGPTSHDVVAVARRALGTRQVGHTGTLDPMATGALVLVVGEATKLVNLLGAQSKAYRASLRLGLSTTTLDAEGEPLESQPVPALSLPEVQRAAQRFCGEIAQRVPLVSAVKVAGKSLHKRARAGEVIEAPVRTVLLSELEVLALEGDTIELSLTCGKGFYVRALARDLAEALGTVGHLSALRRTRNGAFSADEGVGFDALRAAARGTDEDRQRLRARVLPLDAICRALPHVVLDAAGCEHARHGRPAPLESICSISPEVTRELDGPAREDEPLIALDASLAPLAIVQRSGAALRVLRGFRV